MNQLELNKSVKLQGQTVRPFGKRDKFGYLFGDLGNDFFFLLVSSYLMVFYTDVFHISAAAVGVIFLIARLWDGFADVAWGRFIDSRKTTINGKFKPWIFRMSLPLVITGLLMFVHIPGMSDGFYLAWAFVTYIVWGTLYSTVTIPYGSMASVITDDPVERTTLSTWRTTGSLLAGIVVGVIAPLIVFVDNKIDANRLFMAAAIFAVLAVACYMACYKLTTERIVAPDLPKEKGHFSKSMKNLLKNKPFIWIVVSMLVSVLSSLLVNTVNTYLFKEYFGNAGALSMVGLVQIISMILAVPLVKPLVKKFGKKEVASTGLLIAALLYLLLFFLNDLTAIQFIIITGVAMFAFCFFGLTSWAFITDVIDYHEYLTGFREDATVYSIASMTRKVGQALAGGIGGVAIAAVGYDSTVQVQTEAAINGIYSLSTLAPGVLYLIIFLLLGFLYPLNKQRTNQLPIDLAEKRKLIALANESKNGN
ncbi:sugar transporter [Paenibacillus antarcticus]|uniref:Sugar transporter n=2 Tax=Paenibacillus antarcticus TaxID=253703 RepID=A0A168Q9I7_9BACL|nr:MFS transporter [Paenibacillus antarcticus]OAB47532.1 sugar transporter [Paenibacillus antarcticus]